MSNDSHEEIFKSQRLIKMSILRAALNKVRFIGETVPNTRGASVRAISYNNNSGQSGQRVISGQFTFAEVHAISVDKETRFPLDAVYIDVNSSPVKEEIEFMNKLNIPALDGIIERFLKIIESEMHTYKTFEKLHGLKWA